MITTKVIVLPTCSICRDDEDEELGYVATKCGHLFHAECMREWNRNERNRGGSPRCPYCNTHLHTNSDHYHGGDSNSLIRIHQLINQRVTIIEDGKPTPEEELKAARDNLNSIKVILNKETDKLRSAEAEKLKIEAENKTLKTTISKLNQEVKINKEKCDSRAADLRKEKQARQKDLAIHLGEKAAFQKQILDAKHHYEKLRNERGQLSKDLVQRNIENTKLKGIMGNQTNLISNLQAQSMQLSRERDQLAEKLNAMRQPNHGQLFRGQALQSNQQQHHYPVQAMQANQHFYQAPPVDPSQAGQLIDVLQGLSGGFMKLEREYMGIKKLLEEKNEREGNGRGMEDMEKENRQIQGQAVIEAVQDRLLRTTQPPLFSSKSEIDSAKGKEHEIHELVQKIESWDSPSVSAAADQMIDPRLFG
ncbi:hypothetical protein PGTUg99_008361 [Puccinia graminis f. sp. tritici]|uniref:RING-type domain-containing protein n=1 Tax=Puccinia graminis f. sp. tritici TaxID=56615 RepID=A0A5B0MP65_PUCGR|nr:hypothetical protein PGTUg99_008361 [Puccinia graminis f. sp. tritici]